MFTIDCIAFILITLFWSLFLFRSHKISSAFFLLICSLISTVMLIKNINTDEIYRIADYSQSELGVVRIYDLNGDIVNEYDGNLIMYKQGETITFVEVDGDKIITFDEDGDVEVVEK